MIKLKTAIATTLLFLAVIAGYFYYHNYQKPLLAGASILFPFQGGTGFGTKPWTGQVLTGTSAGIYGFTSSNGNYYLGGGGIAGASTSSFNTGIGTLAGSSLTLGVDNIMIGYQAFTNAKNGNDNFIAGYQAGFYSPTTNSGTSNNVFIGYQAGYWVYGFLANNNCLGYQACYGQNSSSTGTDNNAFGYQAGKQYTTGSSNDYFGYYSGYNTSTGVSNNFFGFKSGYTNSSGSYNLAMGYQAGYLNSVGTNNIFLGQNAGYRETGSNIFMIDQSNSTTQRNTIAIEQSNSLMYGNTNASPTSQFLRINAYSAFNTPATSTAQILLPAGSTTTSPLRFTTGTSMTTPVSGSMEYTEDDLFFTINTSGRKRICMADPTGGLDLGSIPYVTTNGRLTDSTSTFSWDSTYGLKAQTIYGSMYGDDLSLNVTVGSLNVYTVIPTGLTGGSSNGFTFSSSGLTALVGGKYKVDWSITGQVPNNNDYFEGAVMINSTGKSETANATTAYRSATPVSIGGTGIITLSANDVVYLSIESNTSTGTYVITHANLVLTRVNN